MRILKKRKPAVVRNDAPTLPPKLAKLLHRIRWLLALACTLFLVVALASYSPDDNSWSHSADLPAPHNWAGAAGAWLADLLLFVFGLSGWWLAALAGLITWFTYRNDDRLSLSLDLPGLMAYGGFTLLLLCSAAFEAIRLYSLEVALPLSAGGILGSMLGHQLEQLLGFAGATALLMAGMVAGLALCIQMSWLDAMEAIGGGLEDAWLALRRKVVGDDDEDGVTQRPAASTEPDMAANDHDAPAKPAAPDTPEAGDSSEPATPTADAATLTPDGRIEPGMHDDPAHEPPVLEMTEDSAQPDTAESAEAGTTAPASDPTPPPRRNPLAPPRLYLPDPILPPLKLLSAAPASTASISAETQENTARLIESKLAEFGVSVKVVGACPGPVITRYELEPAVGVKGAQVVNLTKDLARALATPSVRVVETIPGKACMGLELPNPQRRMVYASDVLASPAYQASPSRLSLALGHDIAGQPMVVDLARMPHVLVAGATGSGKSAALNTMIVSLLYKAAPEEVRLLLIDPKMLELSVYQEIPHLLAPVITDMDQAAHALAWCVSEMERRYRLLSHLGVRNLAAYNQKLRDADSHDERIADPFADPDDPQPLDLMPAIVVVVDELANLMLTTGKKVEELIARLAQKARAAGIHLVLATQRPTVEVITGLIKANIPTRIAFEVASKTDSRTILDQMGAETLLGQGDMLYKPSGTDYPLRVHGALVSDEDVRQVVDFLRRTGRPDYVEGLLDGQPSVGLPRSRRAALPDSMLDPLYDEAVTLVRQSDKASVTHLQRELQVGYNRAIRLMESLEQTGVVSAADSSGKRNVLLSLD